jgi:hypothetical protein
MANYNQKITIYFIMLLFGSILNAQDTIQYKKIELLT